MESKDTGRVMKILAVGDIHLGRLPSRIPEDFPCKAQDLSPEAAWRRTVDLAIEEQVAAVLLAGDVIESEKDFFEGYRALKQGVDRLAEAGVEVIAVAGNHDVEVLPRLARALADQPAFTLLGEGGKWHSHRIEASGEQVTIWGWSFPRRRVSNSPLAGATLERGADLTLGLLHCDLDQHRSDYAPVMQRELDAAGLDGWLLGHVHKPHELKPDSLCGYLGCLSGMDPGEHGARGPWMLTVAGGFLGQVEQIPIAPLRWERLSVDVGELDDVGEIDEFLLEKMKQHDASLFASGNGPDAVGLRVRFTGQTRFVRELPQKAGELAENASQSEISGRHYFIEHCEALVRPRTDLAELATRNDPLGLLAGKLLLLDQPQADPERQALLKDATASFRSTLNESRWRDIESNDEELLEAQVIERLRRTGTAALQTLWARQESAG